MKHTVIIEETIAGAFVIDVPEGQDPITTAIAMYREGRLVVTPDSVTTRQISVTDPEPTDWVEF